MTREYTSLVVCVVIAFAILITADSSALGQQILFSDDFSDGTSKDWQVEIGEWYVGEQSYCVADCGG